MKINQGLFVRKTIYFLFFIFYFLPSYSTTLSTLEKDLNEIIKKTDPSINIGIEIKDLTTNKVIYQRNANRFYVPASSLKVITDAAALMYLGADYRFKTTLYTQRKSKCMVYPLKIIINSPT